MITSLEPHLLAQWVSTGKEFQLIDVRNSYEFERFNIGGVSIELGELRQRRHEISIHLPVVFVCFNGSLSQTAIQLLNLDEVCSNFYNLKGGILGWRAHTTLG